MSQPEKQKALSLPSLTELLFSQRVIAWIGSVNVDNFKEVSGSLLALHEANPSTSIRLFVGCPGGNVELGFAFFDLVTEVTKPRPNITTIGVGAVDSMGLIIYLTGLSRMVTSHTVFRIHEISFSSERPTERSASELQLMAGDAQLSQGYYADIVEKVTNGKTPRGVFLEWMRKGHILTANAAVECGLAHSFFDGK